MSDGEYLAEIRYLKIAIELLERKCERYHVEVEGKDDRIAELTRERDEARKGDGSKGAVRDAKIRRDGRVPRVPREW